LRRLRPEAKWLDGRPPHQHAIDVADWLRTLSLDEYAPQFSGNHITDDLLPKLTADGLKGLGVNSVGHRRRLPDGIALLRDKTDTAAPGKNDELPAKQYDTDPSERWQVTVRFTDLTGYPRSANCSMPRRSKASSWHFFEAADAAVVEHGRKSSRTIICYFAGTRSKRPGCLATGMKWSVMPLSRILYVRICCPGPISSTRAPAPSPPSV
jgi:SAM domain (Sterile alpha motif)